MMEKRFNMKHEETKRKLDQIVKEDVMVEKKKTKMGNALKLAGHSSDILKQISPAK